MKNRKNILIHIVLCGIATLSSCSQKDADAELVLTADRYVFDADGIDKIYFTVRLDGEEVTANSEIFMSDEDGGRAMPFAFTTTDAGKYRFYATYSLDGEEVIKSKEITITANEVEVVDSTIFVPGKTLKKNVAFFAVTGTWCGPCYSYKINMNKILEEYGDDIVQVQLHITDYFPGRTDALGATHDSMKDIIPELDKRFGLINNVPAIVVELQKYMANYSQSTILGEYNTHIADVPKTGIMVNSTIAADDVNVTVTVGAKEAGNYRIGIFLVEDHITAVQNNNAGSYINYDHTNVARQMGTSSLFGESTGFIATGETIEKEFSFPLSPGYDTENLALVVYTFYTDGFGTVIDNSRKVPANGLSGYEYVERN